MSKVTEIKSRLEDKILATASLSQKGIVNKRAIINGSMLNGLIAIAYLIEGIDGNRSWLYAGLVVALCIIPIVLSILIYKKKKDCPKAIMRTLGIGYTVIYSVVLFFHPSENHH